MSAGRRAGPRAIIDVLFFFACKGLSMQLSALWHFPDLTLSASFSSAASSCQNKKPTSQVTFEGVKAARRHRNRRDDFRSLLFKENVHVAAKDGC